MEKIDNTFITDQLIDGLYQNEKGFNSDYDIIYEDNNEDITELEGGEK